MTIDRVAMKELLEKGSDQDLLREMLAFVAARMMDVEVESLTGAAHGERSPERTTSATAIAHASGTPASAPCRWQSRSFARARISRRFSSLAAPPTRP